MWAVKLNFEMFESQEIHIPARNCSFPGTPGAKGPKVPVLLSRSGRRIFLLIP